MVRLLLLLLLIPSAAFAGGSDTMMTGAGLAYPQSWHLTQITDEWVVYTNADVDQLENVPQLAARRYVVAIRKASLRVIPRRNHNLLFPPLAPCLKRLSDTTWVDRFGFPIHVRKYEARYDC